MSGFEIYRDVWKVKKEGLPGIERRQKERLRELVSYAREHSPFYRQLYQDLPEIIDDVQSLPVVSKGDLMPRFDEWVCDPSIKIDDLKTFIADPEHIGHLYQDQYVVCTTSGTTGHPAVLLQDEQTLTMMGALNILRAMPAWINGGDLLRIIGRGMKTAAVWATGGHFLGITMMRRQILQKPARARSMRLFPVQQPLSEIVSGLNEFQPAMLNGYASAIALLAQEQEAGRLNIHPVLVMTSSESLPPGEREHIASVFGCTVADNYGCSEFVAIGSGCRHGWLHVNADWVILEPVDENFQPVPPGETSRTVLLTNLSNHIQPILRYNLGDRVTLRSDPCPCGSPFPAIRVEGRTDEVLRLVSDSGQTLPVLPLAIWAEIKQTPGVLRFQVIQTGPSSLKIRLEPYHAEERDAVWAQVCERVLCLLERQGLRGVSVSLDSEPPMRDPKSGKFRHVWVEFKY